jgi:hypothetical protein
LVSSQRIIERIVMNRWLMVVFCALLTGLSACGSGGDDANNTLNNGNSATIEITERDGIPSDEFVDILHYYFSTQEDGPGLYAYRPAMPDQEPVNVDPNVTVQAPFSVTMPIAQTEGGTSLHLRPEGVFYNAGVTFPPVSGEIPSVKTYVVTTDPSQLDRAPRQVSNHDYPGSFAGFEAYVAHGESLDASSVSFPTQDMRIDLYMTPDEAPLALPEDGKLLGTLLGEGTRSHEHWLYINADGTLKFYNRDFTTSTPVTDEDSGMPIDNLAVSGAYVSPLGIDHLLVLLADAESDRVGQLYRVSRPTASSDGVAKLLTNGDGEVIEMGLPGSILGRTIPGEARRWSDPGAFYFAEGASIFDSEVPARVTRVTPDGWSAIEIEGDLVAAFTPDIFIRVDGGFFWAPSFKPELIYPNGDDPSSWVRTPLADAPQSNESTILSSAGDWVYYQSADDEAVAFNVKTKATVAFADSRWIGASLSSDIGEEISTGLIARQDLETVLVWLGDNRLGALEAANPQNGVVILGQLPATTKEVLVNGPAIGPARLVRIEHEDGGIEVVAIDTRVAQSLRRIMDSPAVEWTYESAIGSTSIELDVRPEATGPLTLF